MRLLRGLIFSLALLLPTWAWAVNTGDLSGAAGGPIECPLENIVTAVVTSTAGANTSGIAAQGAGFRVYLKQAIIYNTGASNGHMIITDGSGGTTKADVPYPASTGSTIVFPTPIPFTANTAIFVDPSGADNIIVTLIGCKRTL